MLKWCKRCEDWTKRYACGHCAPCQDVIAARWHKKHPETGRAKSTRWRKAHPEKKRADRAQRRALLKSQRCTCCTDKQVADQYWLSDGEHMDHIVPLALGGLHCRFNLQQLSVEEHKVKTAADMSAIARAKRTKGLAL